MLNNNAIHLRTKHELPFCCKLENFKFDIQRMRLEISKIQNHFVNVIKANEKFCSNNTELTQTVYDNFDQISLTTYNNQQGNITEEIIESACLNLSDLKEDKIKSYRKKIKRIDIHPGLDERNYSKETDFFSNSYFKDITSSFTAKPIRVRITRLKAHSNIPPHIDYDPKYAVRIIVPIFTNPEVVNQSWVKGKLYEYSLPSDGHAYFLNTGYKHAVINRSDHDRIALMFSLDNQTDIQNINLDDVKTIFDVRVFDYRKKK